MPRKSKALRNLYVTAGMLFVGLIYFNIASMAAQRHEPHPLKKYEALYEKGKFTFSILALPVRLPYYLLEPAIKDDDVLYPLLVILHGGTGNAYAGDYAAEESFRRKYPGYVLVPVAPPRHAWDAPIETPYKMALPHVVGLIRTLTSRLPIDKGRIYVVGCSMGGGGTFGAVMNYPDIFAAAVPIAGAWAPEMAPYMTGTPLWVFHGAQDDVVPVQASRNMVAAIRKAGGTAYYTEYPSMNHNCPSRSFYPEQMWDWLYSQQKPELRQ